MLVAPCSAIHSTNVFTLPPRSLSPLLEPSFGFVAGGHASVAASLMPASPAPLATGDRTGVHVALCSYSELDMLPTAIDALCAVNLSHACTWGSTVTNAEPTADASLSIASSGFYNVMALNCNTTAIQMNASYVFLNPGGNELSSSQFVYVPASKFMMWGWVVLVWVWTANLGGVRFRPPHCIFMVTGMYLILQCCVSVSHYAAWQHAAATGSFGGFAYAVTTVWFLCGSLTIGVLGVIVVRGEHVVRPQGAGANVTGYAAVASATGFHNFHAFNSLYAVGFGAAFVYVCAVIQLLVALALYSEGRTCRLHLDGFERMLRNAGGNTRSVRWKVAAMRGLGLCFSGYFTVFAAMRVVSILGPGRRALPWIVLRSWELVTGLCLVVFMHAGSPWSLYRPQGLPQLHEVHVRMPLDADVDVDVADLLAAPLLPPRRQQSQRPQQPEAVIVVQPGCDGKGTVQWCLGIPAGALPASTTRGYGAV